MKLQFFSICDVSVNLSLLSIPVLFSSHRSIPALSPLIHNNVLPSHQITGSGWPHFTVLDYMVQHPVMGKYRFGDASNVAGWSLLIRLYQNKNLYCDQIWSKEYTPCSIDMEIYNAEIYFNWFRCEIVIYLSSSHYLNQCLFFIINKIVEKCSVIIILELTYFHQRKFSFGLMSLNWPWYWYGKWWVDAINITLISWTSKAVEQKCILS